MKIAFIKPDYRIVGGFEIVVNRITEGLRALGHKVDIIKVDMIERRYALGDIQIPDHIYSQNEEFFRYVMSIQAFSNLDLSEYDCVVPTQPPSFAVNHRNVVVLFYHHLKIFYDLNDVYVEFVSQDKQVHNETKALVHKIDSVYIDNNKFYLAGSNHVASRLKNYNGINEKNISVFKAGISDDYFNYRGETSFTHPICVGRHEFPKRPELFVQAMKELPELYGKLVGCGGKTEDLKKVDQYLQYERNRGNDIDSYELWTEIVFKADKLKYSNCDSNLIFTGKITEEQLINEYANALCVICPAFEEDYGLTALEAMAFGKPVIVCSDGGGYVEFIEEGKNGFIVEPNGKAIAEKIDFLNKHKDIAKEMGEYAYDFSRKYCWENGIKELNDVLVNSVQISKKG